MLIVKKDEVLYIEGFITLNPYINFLSFRHFGDRDLVPSIVNRFN